MWSRYGGAPKTTRYIQATTVTKGTSSVGSRRQRREARRAAAACHGDLSAPRRGRQKRYPPRERRAGTPSRGGAILGSLCPPNRQMAYLSSSYTARGRNFLLLTSTPTD